VISSNSEGKETENIWKIKLMSLKQTIRKNYQRLIQRHKLIYGMHMTLMTLGREKSTQLSP
jgi:hypothetical protein